MPSDKAASQWTELTLEERRERRRLRREKQREDNVRRAAKMHAARLKLKAESLTSLPDWEASLHIGCSGWRYWKWRDSFYAEVLQPGWFEHYLKRFDTVEINASFYSWPTVTAVQAWRRQPGKKNFVYTVKVCELITHVKKFKGTKTLANNLQQSWRFDWEPPKAVLRNVMTIDWILRRVRSSAQADSIAGWPVLGF